MSLTVGCPDGRDSLELVARLIDQRDVDNPQIKLPELWVLI